MVEKICSHCGSTILVGLQYCPSCLRVVRHSDQGAAQAVAVAPEAEGTWFERLQARWQDLTHGINSYLTPMPVEKDDPAFAYNRSKGIVTTTMSEGYTRVVCPKCLRPTRAPLNQSPSARFTCTACFHQFPANMAAEFRRGADLNCLNCGTITFCINGLKVNHCPNCRSQVDRPRDPEKAKLVLLVSVTSSLLMAGMLHAAVTQTMPQFLVWLAIGSVVAFFGFIAMVALGF